jgi:hypothetical protein
VPTPTRCVGKPGSCPPTDTPVPVPTATPLPTPEATPVPTPTPCPPGQSPFPPANPSRCR